jgi:hypothetical protein
MRVWSVVRRDPHVPLALAALLVLAGEWRQAEAGVKWPLFEAAAFAVGFAVAWSRRDRFRLLPVVLLTLLFELASIAIHIHVGAHGDADTIIYRHEGKILLHGSYPSSEYPAGAVGLFALETWVSGNATTANALTMVPVHLLAVVAIWLFRNRWSSWLAAFVALWPLNLFFWEYRFDLVPAALLTVGLLLAYRERWSWSAVALSAGALVKWTPGLAALGLALWVLSSGRARLAGRYVLAFLIPVVLTYAPLLAWSPTEVLHAYTAQGSRGITGESLPFLVLRVFGLAHARVYSPDPASVPAWGDDAAIAFQVVAMLAILALVTRARGRSGAVALAAMLPVTFLLTNRIFSPQFFVVAVAAWAVAGTLVGIGERGMVALSALIGAATVGNAVVWPALDFPLADEPGWIVASAAALLIGAMLTLWLSFAAAAPEPALPLDRGSATRPGSVESVRVRP